MVEPSLAVFVCVTITLTLYTPLSYWRGLEGSSIALPMRFIADLHASFSLSASRTSTCTQNWEQLCLFCFLLLYFARRTSTYSRVSRLDLFQSNCISIDAAAPEGLIRRNGEPTL
jgi:hypothetical protein